MSLLDALDDAVLADDPEPDEPDDDEPDDVESVGVHGEGPAFAGNCRSGAPPHKLGPSAPQPEIVFTWL